VERGLEVRLALGVVRGQHAVAGIRRLTVHRLATLDNSGRRLRFGRVRLFAHVEVSLSAAGRPGYGDGDLRHLS
jgi:hypothetical protein